MNIHNKVLSSADKVKILRTYETVCFQITLYLLQDQDMALTAASEALLQIYEDETFFYEPESNQHKIVKKIAAKICTKLLVEGVHNDGPQHS